MLSLLLALQLAVGGSLGLWASGVHQNHPFVFGVYGLSLEMVGERWGFGLEAETTTIIPFAGVIDIYQVDMGATWYMLGPDQPWRPYARAAVGGRDYRLWVSAPEGGPNVFDHENGLYGIAEVGVLASWSEHWASRLGIKYMHAPFETGFREFPAVRRDLAAKLSIEWLPFVKGS